MGILEKEYNKKWTLIVGIVIIVIAVIIEICSFIFYGDSKEDAVNYYDVTKSGVYSYIDVEYMSDAFAEYTVDGVPTNYYYFVWNSDAFYPVKLSSSDKKRLDDIYKYTYDSSEDAVKPKTVRIYGYSSSMDSKLKKLAVDGYMDIFQSESLTMGNIDRYFYGL